MNAEKTSNENLKKKKEIRNETNIEILDKNKEDWEKFIKNNEKIPNKDLLKKKK